MLRLFCRALAVLIAALVPLMTDAATPAQAHPFGDPQTIEVESAPSEPATVRVRWRAGGADDLTLLGVELGAIPADRVMMDGAVWYEDGDADLLAASPAFGDYLLDRVQVDDGATPCEGDVTALDLLGAGATLTFRCPAPVTTATVTVQTLLDLHPAYRALATGPGGQRAVYDKDATSHDWSLTGSVEPAAALSASTDPGRSAALQLGTIGGVAILAVLSGVFWFGRRGRRA